MIAIVHTVRIRARVCTKKKAKQKKKKKKKAAANTLFIGQTLIRLMGVSVPKTKWLGQCPSGCDAVLECLQTYPAGGLGIAHLCSGCPATLSVQIPRGPVGP